MRFRRHKVLSFLILFLFLAALFLTFFHIHTAGDHSHECGACRLAQAFLLFLAVLVFTLILKTLGRRYFQRAAAKPASLFSGSLLQDRAPPAFSL